MISKHLWCCIHLLKIFNTRRENKNKKQIGNKVTETIFSSIKSCADLLKRVKIFVIIQKIIKEFCDFYVFIKHKHPALLPFVAIPIPLADQSNQVVCKHLIDHTHNEF